MNELVSIITPSYNTAKYISSTIKSVIEQTYQNWEMIIVDDCSTDNTDEVVKPFLKDVRIRYLKNEKNCGAALSRNRALREAKGRWIAFLDSDDLWLPVKLEKQILFMEENDYHFSYTKYEEINAESEPSGVTVSGPKIITRRGMYRYCWPGCLTVMYDANTVGLIQIADIKKNNDYAMWLKVSKKVNCSLLYDTLALYRKGRSASISSHNCVKLVKWHYKLFREAENCSPIISALLLCVNLLCGMWKKIHYVKGY